MIEALRWRIDDRFDHYVRHLAGDGEVVLNEGAGADPDGQYLFPFSANEDALPGTLCFSGSVEYKAYLGVLALRIAGPRITINGSEACLSVEGDGVFQGARLELATARIEDHTPGLAPIGFRLTAAGSEMFFGKYPPGWLLAPATIKYRKPQEATP
ncbi:hypothetical protein ARGLB_037_01310 [Arthrobacter globiformis NBRC 12137]|uniref:Htaa domain-containing protein n=1 Tax=Arthrobacter globiformis (strain ATCC 8010 / DSM 20124 / JCM 1332 / NBRC 12137 / NCIMB 8907 / NRRL B-2979 / 168) TaxID=1077972 RepID=H0QK40_ARTG1|nr:HtaA domain-containing protein [Arthrobacter globiformis]GAB13280.1 hypothetical protein ARGLB_037_01310 [Arthrobacter globiformis NBRC 12137]